jgi:hypothetical protein
MTTIFFPISRGGNLAPDDRTNVDSNSTKTIKTFYMFIVIRRPQMNWTCVGEDVNSCKI